MYAFAAYDARTRSLLLARDRLGEKPLLWFATRGRIVFASEWRALAQHPDAPRGLDADAVALYLQHRFVPAPRTAVAGVHRLPPACALRWRDGRASVAPYWTAPVPEAGRAAGKASREESAALVRRLLEAAVESRLRADVPVGVFLSGGLDSAAIAAIAARRGRVATFTLRPHDADFDEGSAARETAEAIGADHHEIPVSPEALAAGFEEVFARVDEPVGDSSLVPTLLLARGARRHVKVVLGGEGADELYGGYPTYLGERLGAFPRSFPGPVRRFVARRLAKGAGHRNVGTRWLLRRLFEGAEMPSLERHLAWFGAFPRAEQALLWRPEARPAILEGDGLLGPIADAARPALGTGDPVDALLRVDLLLHLPDALLAKVDRTTMLEGLEARAPYLERSLVEASLAMPASLKVGRFTTKRVLREAVADVVPASVLKRRKRGFAVPVAKALEGSLGDRLRERITGSALVRDRLDPAPLLSLLDEHRAGRADHARRLYPLLALLEWSERWQAAPRPVGAPA
jgi:asparagine synthase (glutamine-hydrolysing)